jgi:hypothetical protein
MGASGREFLHFRMEMEHYAELEQEVRDRIEPLKVEVQQIDYSTDETWKALKDKSIKAYKDLKNHEYNLRHKS